MRTLCILYPGCLEFEIMLPAQLLAAKGPVHVATPDGEDFRAAGGFTIRADHSFSSAPAADYAVVLVPGGDPLSVVGNRALDSLLQDARARGAILGAICAGPLLLGQAGLLRGKNITHGYATAQTALVGHFFEGAKFTDAPVAIDDRIVTAKPQAFVEFALAIAHLSGAITDGAKLKRLRKFYRNAPLNPGIE